MKNPRIFVTVDEDLADAIRRIGLGTGQSQSGVIGWVLASQREVLLQLAEVLDLARQVAGPLATPLQIELTKMETDVKEAAAQAQDQLDAARALLEEERDRQELLARGRPDPFRNEPREPIRIAATTKALGGKP